MSSMSFLDKLRVILDITTSSAFFVGIVIFMLLITYLLITTSDKNIKKKRKFYISIYIIILGLIIFFYQDNLMKIFDSMMSNIFSIIYFPNIAVYLLSIMATNIILWTSILNIKINKIVKVIDCCVFAIIHYLLILVLNTITTNELDAFNQTSLYSNNDIVALIEVSSSVFTIWIIFLIVYKLFLNYLTKNKDEVKEIIKKPYLPKNINIVNAPSTITIDNNSNEIVNNKTDFYDQLLTLEDYKLVVDILKREKMVKNKKTLEKPAVIDSNINHQEMELANIIKQISENANAMVNPVIEVTQPIKLIEKTELENLIDLDEIKEPTIIPILEKNILNNNIEAEQSKFLELQALYKNI